MNSTEYISTIKKKFGTTRGKALLQFSMFLGISFIFWTALTLNEDFHKDISIPIKISNIPDSVTLITEPPKFIKISLKAKGYNFLKYKLKTSPVVSINLNNYKQNNRIHLGNTEMQELTRMIFGTNSVATSYSPDSINVYFTSKPGKRLKLELDTDISTESKYIVNGEIKSDIESVMLYALNNIPSYITSIKTEPIRLDDLKESTTIKTRIIAPTGMRVIPDSVNVTIPVEPLILKKKSATIEIKNCPNSCKLITFPSIIELNYLVPKSRYNNEIKQIKIFVDYNDINTIAKKLPVRISDIPSNYRGVTPSVDSVEYIIEQY